MGMGDAHGMMKSGMPFLILFVSQMMKTREAQRSIIDHDDGWVYLGLLCFAIPVHELASAVEAVSAAQLGATADMNPLDMANDIIDRGMPQLIDTPGYVDSVNELMAEDARGGFDNTLSANIAHLQQVFDMNAHKDNFAKRCKDTRAIYSELYTHLSKFIEPARDAENPQIIRANKFLEVFESLETGSADRQFENLKFLVRIQFDEDGLKTMLPECMTTASAIGLLAFFIFTLVNADHNNATQDFEAIKHELWDSLSLDYHDTDQYECEISSAPIQTPPPPEGTRMVVSRYGQNASVAARNQWSPDTTTCVESTPSVWSLQQNLFNDCSSSSCMIEDNKDLYP